MKNQHNEKEQVIRHGLQVPAARYSVSNASLAYGYENQAFQAIHELRNGHCKPAGDEVLM